MANDERYKNVVESMDTVENMFQSMGDSPYAQNPNYTNLLGNVYKNRIQPIFQTENETFWRFRRQHVNIKQILQKQWKTYGILTFSI